MLFENNENNRKISYLYVQNSFTPISLKGTLAHRIRRFIQPSKVTKDRVQTAPFRKTFYKRSKSAQETIKFQKIKENTIDIRKKLMKTAYEKRRISCASSLGKRRSYQTVDHSKNEEKLDLSSRTLWNQPQFIKIASRKQLQFCSQVRKKPIAFHLRKKKTSQYGSKLKIDTEVRPWSGYMIDDA